MRKMISSLTAAAVLAGGIVFAAAAPATAQTSTEASCSGDTLVSETLEAGTQWQLCWRVDRYRGLIVEDVSFKGKNDDRFIKVLDSLSIGQLNVPYDTGYNQWNDITSYGFGGGYTRRMEPQQCPDGEIRSTWIQESRPDLPVLCIREVDDGLGYNSFERKTALGPSPDDGLLFTARTTDLVLTYTSKVDWYEYQTEFRFADDGEIDVRLGATGDLAPSDFADTQAQLANFGITPENYGNYGWPIGEGPTHYAVSHYHSAIWRVDFGIDDGELQLVEQFDSDFTGVEGRRAPMLETVVTPIETEGKFTKDTRRIWRVLNPNSLNADGHPRSYQIIPGSDDIYGANPETDYDVAFSQYKADEQYASFNLITSKPGIGVPEYIADEETLTDPVAWVNVGFHHIDRDEDQSPMPIHWQSFTLYPRDFSAQSPTIPDQRLYVNGNVGRINTPIPTPEPTDPPTSEPTTPPTDGGTTPPTDGGTTPPAEGETTPPAEGGTTPPSDDGTTPPSEGGTTTPTDGVTTPAVTVGSPSVVAGTSQSVFGSGFESGETVVATLYSTPVALGEHVADSFGNVSFDFTVPQATEEGTHRVELVGQSSGAIVSESFTVTRLPVAAALFNQLGNTGSEVGGLVTGGTLLLLLGGLLAGLAYRVRRAEQTAGITA